MDDNRINRLNKMFALDEASSFTAEEIEQLKQFKAKLDAGLTDPKKVKTNDLNSISALLQKYNTDKNFFQKLVGTDPVQLVASVVKQRQEQKDASKAQPTQQQPTQAAPTTEQPAQQEAPATEQPAQNADVASNPDVVNAINNVSKQLEGIIKPLKQNKNVNVADLLLNALKTAFGK